MSRSLRYIVANCKYGQKKDGVDFGARILHDNIRNNLRKKNPNKPRTILSDYKIDSEDFENNFEGYQTLYNVTKQSLLQNEMPFIFGGDHSIALSTVAASFDVLKEDMSLIWIDAHADMNTFETSITGNLHGMPLSSVFNLMNPIIKNTYVPNFDQIIYLGLRSIDDEERKILDKKDILYYEMKDMNKYGIYSVINEVTKKTKNNIHVSFDVDVLDPLLMQSTGTPVPYGMLMSQAYYLIDLLKENKTIRCVDFVEYNPLISDKKYGTNNSLTNCLNLINKIID